MSTANATEADEQLRRAIQVSDIERFQSALEAGANVNARDVLGMNSLHGAVVFSGDAALVGKLLSMGVDINATDNDGATPLLSLLRHAHYSGNRARVEQMARLLLSRGARANIADKDGRTPTAAALDLGHVPITEALLRVGGVLPPDALMKVLALGGDATMISFLMGRARDLDLKLRNASGQTLLHRAAESEKRLFLLRWLVERGGDLQAHDDNGRSILGEAAIGDNIAGLAYLHGLGLKLDAADRDGHQAVHLAAYGARYSVLEWLVAHGADLQARDRWGRRALDMAIDSHRFAYASAADRLALATLLGGGEADLGRGRFRDHPLHHAIRAENLREAERLLEAGANANAKNESGHTPLRRAIDLASGGPATADQIAFGRKMLPLLLRHGANTTLRMPTTMITYDEHARRNRFGDEMERLKTRYARQSDKR